MSVVSVSKARNWTFDDGVLLTPVHLNTRKQKNTFAKKCTARSRTLFSSLPLPTTTKVKEKKSLGSQACLLITSAVSLFFCQSRKKGSGCVEGTFFCESVFLFACVQMNGRQKNDVIERPFSHLRNRHIAHLFVSLFLLWSACFPVLRQNIYQ